MPGVYERCVCYSIREASILFSEAIKIEERCGVCFWSTEEDVQYTSHL
jgi:hypothetical protein